MPAETPDYCEREAILTFEEIARVVRIAVELGVDDVRLTYLLVIPLVLCIQSEAELDT